MKCSRCQHYLCCILIFVMCLWKFCLGRRRVAEFVSKLLVARVKIDPLWLDWQVSTEAFRVASVLCSHLHRLKNHQYLPKANNLLGCNEFCGHLRKCDDTFRNALKCQEKKERGPHNVKKLSAPCAEICHLDSQVAAMRMFQSSKCTIILRKSPPSTENDCLTPSPWV